MLPDSRVKTILELKYFGVYLSIMNYLTQERMLWSLKGQIDALLPYKGFQNMTSSENFPSKIASN